MRLMSAHSYRVKYPRRILIRRTLLGIGRTLLAALAEVDLNGKERLPQKGPIILAGNHVEVLEAVMLAVYTPGLVEFLGTGDIPFDPNYAWIANTYGLIPVNRGNFDRKALEMSIDLLRQGGILGIFPEGGTWDPANMRAQTGIAWLSYKAQVPVLPIGFGGIKGALSKALRLKRPKLVMNVGEMIPPVSLQDNGKSLKDNLENAANNIMAKIKDLVPEEDLEKYVRHVNEKYELQVQVLRDGQPINPPETYAVEHGSAYAMLLYQPVVMDVLVRNLALPVHSLKNVGHVENLTLLINAWNAILTYLKENPGYFTYRFGVSKGVDVKKALMELKSLGNWAYQNGLSLTLQPIRSYQNANTGAQVVERGGCFPASM